MSFSANTTRRLAPSTIGILERRLGQYTLLAYLAFVAGYFLTSNAVDHYKFLVGFLFIPGLLLLPRLFAALSHDVVLRLAAAYLLYLLASALWAETPDYALLANHGMLAGLILFFVAITAFLSATEPKWFDIIIVCTVTIAAGNALLSILLWDDLQHLTVARLVGLGTLREPNSAGAVYGFYGLLAVVWRSEISSKPVRAALFASAFVLFGFLLLTQARAAIIAAVAGLTLLALLNKSNRPVVHLLVLSAVIGAALFVAAGAGDHSLLRNWTWQVRLELWSDSLRQIADAPLFGSGYLSALEVYSHTENKSHANVHNSYLAALRDGGAVGLALLTALLGAAIHRAVQAGRASGDYALLALLCFGLIYMLTSTDTLITRPRELWVILWFPLGLLAGQRLAAGRQDSATHTPAAY
ncbi:MAG: O-antigen ligase family protein [Gammaproteobacteria bacterium]|nr:MAG: O-antigen ligase family protein [Gammaproteobacteria bacterium]